LLDETAEAPDVLTSIVGQAPEINENDKQLVEQYTGNIFEAYGKKRGILKPFRSYHVVTSNNHIIYNNIQSDAGNSFNTVTIGYSDKAAEMKDGEIVGGGDEETFTLRADGGLLDEDVRELYERYENCVGYEQAKQYAVSRLKQALEMGYNGSLVIIGNPAIKPSDIVYIFDEYNDMYGPIEVEQVVHKMSHQNGFITEITPSMCVHVNQWSTISTADAMGYIAEHALRQVGMPSLATIQSQVSTQAFAIAGLGALGVKAAALGASVATVGTASLGAVGGLAAFAAVSNWALAPIANAFFNSGERSLGQNGSTNFFGLVGTFIFRKLITKTQLNHPFRFSPLVKNGRPLLGGLPSRRTDGSFIVEQKTMFKEGMQGSRLQLDKIEDEFFTLGSYINSTGKLKF
jgi:hypothetical protein